MERTVPQTASEAIELYIRTYYSLLRSTGDIAIEALTESHVGMNSLLHPHADEAFPDISALIYASLRLPDSIAATDLILLGQRSAVFERAGYPVETWQEVAAKARRRRSFYDGEGTLAIYIASRSDIDDIIPILTAYQIEWNKLHQRLSSPQAHAFLDQLSGQEHLTLDEQAALAAAMGVEIEALERLISTWDKETIPILQVMAEREKRFALRLLAGSLADYRKATRHWWLHVRNELPQIDFESLPIYFVSSNTHSIVNLWSGYALRQQEALLAYMKEEQQDDLFVEYQHVLEQPDKRSQENFLYYALKKYLQDRGEEAEEKRLIEEQKLGIHRVISKHGFDLNSQVIEIGKLNPEQLDPRLCLDGIEALKDSDALIFNIDYPLGMAAYEILTRIYENAGETRGVYIMGKAATLNGRIGDVMIPTVVHDEHSQNTYLFSNCFYADDVAPFLTYGTVLDNQKSVTVRGTFLQNPRYMGVFYREGYTDIEMEAGPYLSAIYELTRPKRHPYNEIVSLRSEPLFELGILHYASDKPLSKGQNLGAGSLSYQGMAPTYAVSIAILRHIISSEIDRMQRKS